ncbi:MAG: hypothetical protein ACK5MA_10740 [Parachlamydiaceae bacterium]
MTQYVALALYAAGLIQGIDLVAFPAASTILTDPALYGLSSIAYGALFISQALLSIGASASNPHLIRRYGAKQIFLWGVAANFFAMLLLALSNLWMHNSGISYGMVITCYLLGYGIAAFGVGPLQERMRISLPEIYLIGALIAFILGIISLVIIQKKPKESHG